MSDLEDKMMCPNRRLHRARALAAWVMQTIEEYIPHDESNSKRHAYEDLLEVFMHSGVDVITDDERRAAGLPPRGMLGYSDYELQIMEARRLEALTKPVSVFIPLDTP